VRISRRVANGVLTGGNGPAGPWHGGVRAIRPLTAGGRQRGRRADAPRTTEGSGSPWRGLVAPELVHEAIQGNDASSVESDQHEHCTLLRAAERKVDAAAGRGHGKVERCGVTARTASRGIAARDA
jgi:hypothetical protein